MVALLCIILEILDSLYYEIRVELSSFPKTHLNPFVLLTNRADSFEYSTSPGRAKALGKDVWEVGAKYLISEIAGSWKGKRVSLSTLAWMREKSARK